MIRRDLLHRRARYFDQPAPLHEFALDERLELRRRIADRLAALLGEFRLYFRRAQRLDGGAVDPIDDVGRRIRRGKQAVPQRHL